MILVERLSRKRWVVGTLDSVRLKTELISCLSILFVESNTFVLAICLLNSHFAMMEKVTHNKSISALSALALNKEQTSY